MTMPFYPITADRRVTSAARTEGLFARMIRLWVEHHQRMLELGLRPPY
jgi:hypothetical protein